MKPKTRLRRKSCLISILVLIGLCLLLSLISALTNAGLPQQQTDDRLGELDRARLAEALQLEAQLGDRV